MNKETTQKKHSDTPAGSDRTATNQPLQLLAGVADALSCLLQHDDTKPALFSAFRALGTGARADAIFLFFEQPGAVAVTEQFAVCRKGLDWEQVPAHPRGFPLSPESHSSFAALLKEGQAVCLERYRHPAGTWEKEEGKSLETAWIFPIMLHGQPRGTLTLGYRPARADTLAAAETAIAPFLAGLGAFLYKKRDHHPSSPNPFKIFFKNSTDAAYYVNCGRPIPTYLSLEEQTAIYFENAFLEECNAAMASAYGYLEAEELIGRKVNPSPDRPPKETDVRQFQEFVRNGYRLSGAETTYALENGDRKHFLGQAVGVLNDGHLLGFWGSQKDITGKRKAEIRVREEQKLRQNILSTIPDYILVVDYSSFQFSYLNQDQAEPIFGYYPGEIEDPGQLFQQLVPSGELETNIMPFFNRIATADDDELLEIEYRLRDAAGRQRWVYQRAKVFSRREDGQVREYLTLLQDITEIKEAELIVRRQRDYLRQVIDLNPNLIFAKDREGRFTLANQAVAEVYCTTVDDLIGKKDADFNPYSKEIELFLRENREVLDTGQARIVHQRVIHEPNGQARHVQVVKKPLKNPDGEPTEVLGVITDLTRQKQVEAQIRQEQKLNQSILDTLPDFILVVDYETFHFTYLNQQPGGKVLGYALDQLEDPVKFLIQHIHPEDLKSRVLPFSRAIAQAGDEDILEGEFRIRSSEGSWLWLHQRVKVFRRHSDGRVKEYLLLLQDITSRKEAQQQIEESEKRYRNFITYSTDGIYFINCGQPIPVDLPVAEQVVRYYETAYIEECNLAISRMYGGERIEDMIGTRVLDWHGGEHFEENALSFAQLVRDGYRIRNVETIEKDLRGRVCHFLNQAVGIVEDGCLVGIWGTQQDITEKKSAERALRESEERLERILEGAKLGIWDWDLRTQKMITNEQWAGMLGYDQNEIAPNAAAFFELIHPADREKLNQAVVQHLAGSTHYFDLEIRMRTRSGDWKWIYDRGQVVLRDEDGTPLRAFGVHIDITERKEAELALMEREALFRSVFETSPLGITFSNAKGKIRQVNQKLCEILGYSREELVGKAFRDITHPEDISLEQKLLKKSRKQKPTFLQYEKRFLHREEKVIWASVAISFIYQPDGTLNYTIGMVEDITEKKTAIRNLEKSEALQKAVISAMPDMKLRFNSEGVYIDYYPSADTTEHPSLPPDQFLNNPVEVVLPLQAAQKIRKGIDEAIRAGEVKTLEFTLPFPKGDQFYEARISAINEEEAIVVVRNITDRIEAEANLQDKIQELDIKNQQLKAYIDSNMQLENFAYIASHDLREPLRTMRSFAQLLQQRHRDQLDPQAREYLQFITDGAENMNRLIEDLLAYSRVNSQPNDLSEVSPATIIKQVTGELTGALRETGAEIETADLPAAITANPTRLRQLFQNLIGNAVKFHRPGVPPRVRITGKDLGSYWQFSVADNGIGIKPEFHEKIFRLFQKLHPGSAFRGTGLGLAICKKIVEQHQGDIWLTSEPGEGTMFFFTIRKQT